MWDTWSLIMYSWKSTTTVKGGVAHRTTLDNQKTLICVNMLWLVVFQITYAGVLSHQSGRWYCQISEISVVRAVRLDWFAKHCQQRCKHCARRSIPSILLRTLLCLKPIKLVLWVDYHIALCLINIHYISRVAKDKTVSSWKHSWNCLPTFARYKVIYTIQVINF